MRPESLATQHAPAGTGIPAIDTDDRRDDVATEAAGGSREVAFVSSSRISRRWVGGCVGHVYHTDKTHFVSGCRGSISKF
jgi:hypothetical protein